LATEPSVVAQVEILQFVLPSSSEYVPGPHVMQAVELVEAVFLLYIPAWQSAHVVFPSEMAKEPGGHGEQKLDSV
jgi:hypothetical protein